MAARYDRRLSILDGGWGAQSGSDLMFQQLEEGYDEGPDNVALICTHQSWGHLKAIVGEEPVGGCLTWTYRQLMKAARDLAIVWEGYGVERGDTIVAFLPSCAEWALAFWVAAILELTFVPLDPMSLAVNSGKEQAYPLDMLRTSIVLVSNIRDAYNFDELYPDLKTSVRCKIVCHEQVDFFFRGWVNFEPEETYRLRATNAGDKPNRLGPEDRAVADERIAVILFTQESSPHRPKGCPLAVHNIRTALVNQYILPQQRYLVTFPSSSSATLETVMVAWKRGAAVVFPGAGFSAQMALSAVELHRCTRLVCASPQLEELIKDPSRTQKDLDSLESLSVGGGVVKAGLVALGQHALQTQWASSFLTMAEGFGVLGWRSVSLTDRTLESVGTVMPGSMVKICPAVGRYGHVLSRGEEGRLHIGGDAIIQEYLGEAPNGHFYQDSDGVRWFVTNYLATMDKNGLIRLTTQLKSSEPVISDDRS
ncbi:acetyl-CoA synthetase-like protein [Aureobasidium melanogenum CBS 110374]|uniref:Acetyl-CoA synthetase-like protein n=1 Tax=Aureobasidium melanogenum (strain CBS 110374) TaxID=1043003 RepID=A0A074W638_AURM1|nr:acetyl-CoA synthetase-like protein [Aureobasidium melanogenum CBS 110374]KEQ67049.1 acetyl-CoA synthetase-like protein [Aureobasidium melanogenum CBS 110374]